MAPASESPYIGLEGIMATSMRSVLNRLRRQLDSFTPMSRTVLAVTGDLSCRMSLRVLALEQGWRILFADCLEDGLRLQQLNSVSILVYDCGLPGVEWRHGLRTLLDSHMAIFPIVMSPVLSPRLWFEALECGGYDIARNPVDPTHLAALVNGALALAKSVDSPDPS
jgi:DNA-binding NtrC family response regulator